MAEIDNLADELEALRGGMGDDHMLALRKMNGRASFMDKHFHEILGALRNREPSQQYPAEMVSNIRSVCEWVSKVYASGPIVDKAKSVLAELPEPTAPDEAAMQRLLSIPTDEGSYGDAVLEVYGPLPQGQFYRDLAAIKRVRAEKGEG